MVSSAKHQSVDDEKLMQPNAVIITARDAVNDEYSTKPTRLHSMQTMETPGYIYLMFSGQGLNGGGNYLSA